MAFIIVLLLTACGNTQKETNEINQAKQYFDNGDYLKAYDIMNTMDNPEKLDDYRDKIELMGQLLTYTEDDTSGPSGAFYYVGKYKEFKKQKLEEIAYPYVINSAQVAASRNTNIAENFKIYSEHSYTYKKEENDKIAQLLEPLLSEDKELFDQIASKIENDVDYNLAEIQHDELVEDMTEKQQLENSDVVVENKNAYCDNSYWKCEGSVKNNTNDTVSYVKVQVKYFDNQGEVLTSDWTYAADEIGIDPNESKQFSIMTAVKGNVSNYEIEVISYK